MDIGTVETRIDQKDPQCSVPMTLQTTPYPRGLDDPAQLDALVEGNGAGLDYTS